MNGRHPVRADTLGYDPSRKSRLVGAVRRLHRDESGATSTEYILILALIVLPIALLYPVFMMMIKTYAGRMTSLMGTPFP